jgi:DNA-binding transcriptional LysR family regulator
MRSERSDLALELRECHPDDALDLVRANEVDVALVYRADTPLDGELVGVRLYEDQIYLLSTTPNDTIEAHRESNWIAGCDKCRRDLEAVCIAAGFEPRIGLRTEGIHVHASFVAAGLGVTTMPGTALASLDLRRLRASPLPDRRRQVWAVTAASTSDLVHEFIDKIRKAAQSSSSKTARKAAIGGGSGGSP